MPTSSKTPIALSKDADFENTLRAVEKYQKENVRRKRVCPLCQSDDVMRSRFTTGRESIRCLLWRERPYWCWGCNTRFYAPLNLIRSTKMDKCNASA
jgi:hypothetical protein